MLNTSEVVEVCAFRVGEHCFAIASAGVAEVLSSAAIAPVPLAPPAIVGLLHLRGRIVPVIDMRQSLGLPDRPPAAASTHLVIRLADDWYSLLVDEVLDVQTVGADRIEHPGKPVGGPAADAVTGVYADAHRLVHLVDPERVVQALHRQRTVPFVRHGDPHGG
ncbi:MAG: purine-binding chemotaxis protein CheW [Planctomycetia bacterium]|nr:purine-binding chemotaxis protein CheW [Planctomycetia bacterium]